MIRRILILFVVGLLGVFLSVPSWAGNKKVTPLATPPVPEMKAPAETSSLVKAQEEGDYIIGPGDVLDIAVWKDEALTRSCVVRPDGFISFPLIGDVRASGKTSQQLKLELEGRLIRYVPGLTLSLEIKQINSMIIYVIGKVNIPGRFVVNANIDVLQALSTAGGLNPFAKQNDIKIFRKDKEETTIFPFQYDKVVDGKRLEQNIQLNRGDIVVVP
ncbi:MAG TPA: polysaccharide biosynthesis/export family protein [Smithella sp.]|nr:polysaccharide biosynthesis/export family protein [Smithella sp.]